MRSPGFRAFVLPTLVTVATACLLNSAPALAPDAFASQADLIASLLPAVVNITVRKVAPVTPSATSQLNATAQASQSPTRKVNALASGFIIDSSGIIVTNRHVVDDATEITVVLQDKTKLRASVVGTPPSVDLALLKVDTREVLPS